MAEQEGGAPSGLQAVSDNRQDWKYLLLLLLLFFPLRAWLLYNPEVAARDSTGYIRNALDFKKKPWKKVLLANDQHPGYPFSVWLMSMPVRAVAGLDPVTMRVSAQLVSFLAALLLLFPLYFLGKALFDRQVGFWGTLLFQYWPVGSHHLADGITEALFMLLVALALWQGVLGVRRGSWWNFAWCGACGGLAYLTRPEGALVVAAVGLVLVGMQLFQRSRQPWPRFLLCGTSLSVSAAGVGSIYVLTTHHLSIKPAAKGIIEFSANHPMPGSANDMVMSQGVGREPLAASVFGVFFPRADNFPLKLGRSLRALGSEISHGFHYLGWVPALLGLCWFGTRLRREPAFWVLATYFLFHSVILLLLGMSQSYVSDRHVMVLVLCGSFLAAAGLRALPVRVWAWQQSCRQATGPTGQMAGLSWHQASLWSLVFLVAMAGFCLPKAGERLHGNRVGNRAAGVWLAGNVAEGDVVVDDHAWSHYYAGLVFKEGKDPVLPPGYQPTCYVVITRSKDPDIARGRNAEERKLCQSGKLVYHWPENRAVDHARVVIYAEPRDPQKHPWRLAKSSAE